MQWKKATTESVNGTFCIQWTHDTCGRRTKGGGDASDADKCTDTGTHQTSKSPYSLTFVTCNQTEESALCLHAGGSLR